MLSELADAIREQMVPDVIEERCVHSLVQTATCSACVDTCPRDAWVLNEECLGIDTTSCDGCGLCAPVCPQGAIIHQHDTVQREGDAYSLALLACERAGVDAVDGVVPCVHALGVGELLDLYRQGVRELDICTGTCDNCARGGVKRLEQWVSHANTLLCSRDLQPITLRELPADTWQSTLTALRPAGGAQMNRRLFLRRAIGNAMNEGLKCTGFADSQRNEFIPPAMYLSHGADNAVMPVAPSIDPTRCNGCDACANLCPHDAISLETTDTECRYNIVAEKCSGCGICRDACDQSAVSLVEYAPVQQTEVSLRSSRCQACGAPFHFPSDQDGADNLCRICRQSNHAGKLFQVL